MAQGASNAVEIFVSFTMSLMTGLGENVLYGMQLAFDSYIDFIIGMVWSVQDVLYAFNLRSCKVPSAAIRYDIGCACGDAPHMIPPLQRAQTEGALWCVGSLNVPFPDGSSGIIHNPYSLDALSGGNLPELAAQGVDPMVVWARCKSNYAQKIWDEGAWAQFAEAGHAREWAQRISSEFLECMTTMPNDKRTCMTMYHSLVYGSTPDAYFLYIAVNSSSSVVAPDACLVYSGLRGSVTGELKGVLDACATSEQCDLNPLGDSNKVSVASVHGTVRHRDSPGPDYSAPMAKLQRAYADFNETSTSAVIDAALFSADGDFIHEYFDCVFMGPYSRVDILPCDAEGVLDCPFYARDENGSSRNFTACFGDDAMQGDHMLPFTCGSSARRAIIKYFFRDYYKPQVINNLTKVINAKIASIYANYTSSMGCGASCTLEECTIDNEFAPCMETAFELTSSEVGEFVIDEILAELPRYYAHVFHTNAPWMTYYDGGKPFDWTKSEAAAKTAQRLSHFSPAAPIVEYSAKEAYSMIKDDNATSLWSMCTSLLGHVSMSVPSWPTHGSIEEMVQQMSQAAMNSASPFVWHSSRRHAPSQSSACKRKRRAQAPGRLMVEEISVDLLEGAALAALAA